MLVGSALRWMHGDDSGLEPFTRKLLGFTDNRQDAALQSGHFNDFLFVSLVRAGFLGALEAAGANGLRSDELGVAQQKALGFDRPTPEIRAEWLLEPDLKGFNLQEAESDAAAGARLPRLVRPAPRLALHESEPRAARARRRRLPRARRSRRGRRAVRERAADAPRRAAPRCARRSTASCSTTCASGWRFAARCSTRPSSSRCWHESHSRLRAPWGFGIDEKPRRARWLMIAAPSRRDNSLRDEDLIVRGGSRSALGKTSRAAVRSCGTAARRSATLKSKEFDALIEALLKAASTHGLVSEEVTPFGNQTGWRLNDACVRFMKGTPTSDPVHPNENAFFRDFYANLAQTASQPGASALRLRGARAHRAGRRREARGAREALPLRRRRSARSWRRTRSTCARSARPTASCPCSSARRRWSSASTSRR